MKKLIAYSSIAHMGFVTLGMFLFSELGIEGSIVQMISHGFVSAAMFLCVGVLYDRMHSRQIADYGGVVNTMPKFAALTMVFAMANAGLPGTSGFVGGFMVILRCGQGQFLDRIPRGDDAHPRCAFTCGCTSVSGTAQLPIPRSRRSRMCRAVNSGCWPR
jgi:NADH:ubiquinone oxidoreductase subunit 4 (subunit M)